MEGTSSQGNNHGRMYVLRGKFDRASVCACSRKLIKNVSVEEAVVTSLRRRKEIEQRRK